MSMKCTNVSQILQEAKPYRIVVRLTRAFLGRKESNEHVEMWKILPHNLTDVSTHAVTYENRQNASQPSRT
jgi:hypothetical protein